MRTLTLDDVVEQLYLARLDLVKIDVEGAEELVLRGALRTLNTFRPTVIFEVNFDATATLGLAGLRACRALRSLGYQIVSIGASGSFQSLGETVTGRNLVALPEKR